MGISIENWERRPFTEAALREQEVSRYEVIYVNGIFNNYKYASETTRIMANQSKMGILLFHNRHRLNGLITDCTNKDISSLKGYLRLCWMCRSKKILLILHSLGAYIGYKALKQLKEEGLGKKLKSSVTVHAFGGVCLIPKALAKEAVNYLCQGDLVDTPFLGLSMTDVEDTWNSLEMHSGRRNWKYNTRIIVNPDIYFFESSRAHSFRESYLPSAVQQIGIFKEEMEKEIAEEIQKTNQKQSFGICKVITISVLAIIILAALAQNYFLISQEN